MTGREFRAIRLRLGLTQESLATRLGVIRVTVTRWERGTNRIPPVAALAVKYLEIVEHGPAKKGRG